ncbi:MAG: family 78 glycoside hydrolase catalytic domain [Bacteroidaceae bacterium]|nr:family 78 glycoside hydrolase catalytic domain [Bacteroidaceae bacterium]
MRARNYLLTVLVASVITGCSRTTSFVGERTAPLDKGAWSVAKWISAADAPVITGRVNDGDNGRSADGSSWFVSTLKNEQKVINARWMTAGLGIYELYINGQRVGEEVLKPGFTHPMKTKRTFTYDITQAFCCKAGGENTLSVQVTPGWWADKIVTPGDNEGMIGHKCAFRGVLQLTFADGSTKRYGTDLLNWRAGIAGPVKNAGIFEGERYDAREPMGYNATTLSVPEENMEFQGQLLPSTGAEIYLRWDIALPAVEAYVWKNVEGADNEAYGKVVRLREYKPKSEILLHAGETLVVDFGQNAAAVPAFLFKAAEGTRLTCLPGELLNDGNGARSRGMDGPEGSVHRQNLRSHNVHMRLDYTFGNADGYVSYCPRTTFFGYRYVSITSTGDVQFKDIQSVPVTSIAQRLETGVIETGDASINKLISNTIWGMRSNYLSVPTDCPQRNERQGWTADTQVFTETGTFFANTCRFFHKWMHDMRDTQSPEGGFPGVAPWGQYRDAGMMRLGWADAGIIVPWTVWKQFADSIIIEENWEAMNRFMNHINDTRYDHQTLSGENGNYQWADWLSYEPLESCSGRSHENGQPRPETVRYWSYLSASYWAIDAGMMADMAAATGRDAAPYRQMADNARAYLRETFLNADGTFKTDILNTMQTPALFALKNRLVEGEAKKNMIARLRENFAQHDGCLQTGFLGTSILMQTLTENGMQDIAYDLLFQRKNPSWLYSVDNGATTIWERWNSYMVDKGMGPQGMNSFNHYAYGCVCQWLWERAAGIAADPAQPGFKHIIMSPVPDKRLGHLTAEYHSAAGTIKSAWRYQGDKWTWKFTIPKGATATVTLPGETESREYRAGSYTVSR